MPHALDGVVLAAALAEVLGALFVAALAAGVQRNYPRPHLVPWGWSWLAGSAWVAVGLVSALRAPLTPAFATGATTASQTLRYLQIAGLVIATLAFRRGEAGPAGPRRALVAAALAVGLLAAALPLPRGPAPALLRSHLPSLVLVGVLSWSGLSWWRRGVAAENLGHRLVGGALLAYGFDRLHLTLLGLYVLRGGRAFEYSLLLGFVNFALLGAAGLGLVIALLEEERQRAARAEAGRRAHEEELVRERDRLRVSEEKFAKVFRSSPDAITISAPSDGGRILDANAGFERLTGYSAQEAIGRTTVELGLWARPEEREDMARHLAEHGRGEREVELRMRSGERRICIISGETIEIGGRPLAVAVTRDITERRRAEAALRNSEAELRALFASMEDVILVLDAEGRYVRIAPTNPALLYRPSEELLGRRLHDIFPADRADAFLAQIRRCLEARQTVDLEYSLSIRGEEISFAATVSPMLIDSVVWVARNVTESKRAGRERARLEGELRRGETLAAMGSLVAGVAHEVRTPLFSLSATLDALEAGAGTPEQQQELKDLLRAQVRRLSSLMQDLLDYGRPPRLKLARSGLTESVRRAVHACQAQAASARVGIEVEVPEGLPEVQADASRLQQVFENLLANAVQHAPRGSTVKVAAAAVGDPAPGLAWRVEDEGPGLAPSDLDRVFQPFFSRRRGGTGMGLAVAQRFVEAHGGTLVAANRPQGGAVFTVLLPAAPGAAAGGAVA